MLEQIYCELNRMFVTCKFCCYLCKISGCNHPHLILTHTFLSLTQDEQHKHGDEMGIITSR